MEEENIRHSGLTSSIESIHKLYKKIFHSRKKYPLNEMQYLPLHKTLPRRLVLQIRKRLVPFFLEKSDLESSFLFFPIHHDDEAHLSWGEHFTDQYDIIEKIAECLPIGTNLSPKTEMA